MAETLNSKKIRPKSWMQYFAAVTTILIIASLSSSIRMRLDLTGDKRYTLSAPTVKVLTDIKNDIYIQVYLDGDIPIPLKRLKRSVREMLDEFRIISGPVSYTHLR